MHGDYAVSLTVTQFSSQATNHSRKPCDCSFTEIVKAAIIIIKL